jgi:hypothetical protein
MDLSEEEITDILDARPLIAERRKKVIEYSIFMLYSLKKNLSNESSKEWAFE